MKKHSIILTYNFDVKEFQHLVKDHTSVAREFLAEEYGIKEETLTKLIRDFDLIYLLEDNVQYLGILHKIFYDDAVREYYKEKNE